MQKSRPVFVAEYHFGRLDNDRTTTLKERVAQPHLWDFQLGDRGMASGLPRIGLLGRGKTPRLRRN
jgi:hypothetical protein